MSYSEVYNNFKPGDPNCLGPKMIDNRSSSKTAKSKHEEINRSVASVQDPPEAEPLDLDISDYSPETLDALKPLLKMAAQMLWHWKKFPIVLPSLIEDKIEPTAGKSLSAAT